MQWSELAQARICMLIDRGRVSEDLFERLISACELRATTRHAGTKVPVLVVSGDVIYFEEMWNL